MYLLLFLCYDSVEYWFRCMDLDGDGVLSMYEMEYFYVEQLERMEALGIETLPFEDCLCQVRMEVVDIETLPTNEMSRMSKNKLVISLERRIIKHSNGAKIMDLSQHKLNYWTLNMPGVESFKQRKAHLKFAVM